jgi:hypothetical protein
MALLVPMQSCLALCDWDMERAYELLRKKGLAAAAKKASRHAAEGLVGLAQVCAAALLPTTVPSVACGRTLGCLPQLFIECISVAQACGPKNRHTCPS